MDDENKRDIPGVQADNQSIAVGGITIGGDISGNIHIGSTIGYTTEEVSVLITQITSTFQPKPFDGRCPYKGLDVFEEEDAELFFGREKLVDDLVNRVKGSQTVFVTGPSGSGKSSLVRAGLIHALKQGKIKGSERWLYATMKPGRDPLESLATAFSRLKSPELGNYFRQHVDQVKVLHECAESALTENKNQRLVLFIDQFEEVFTQISNEAERVAILNLLTHAATIENGRVIILFSMRSDFVSNCATYPQLNSLLNQQFVQIGAMQPEELVSAIAQPALRVGLRIDSDLIAQIINEMKSEPGALPLMQFALKDLFDSLQEKSGVIALTLNDYLQRGGIHKALERHADDSFLKLNENEQELTRSIFSGLIEIGRGTQDTRRTALFDELIPANTKVEEVKAIVQKLADARLVTTDEQAGKDTVTIAHEKLIEAWPWLKKLVNENRDVIALQNEIASNAKEWDEHNHDASYLYTGARLANAREQLESKKIGLNELAESFIETGAKVYANELETAKQRTVQLRRQARNLTVALVFTITMVVIAIYFGVQSRQQAKVSLAHQMAAQAQTINATRNSRQMQAVLLALHSIQLSPSSEAAQVLLGNLAAEPIAQTTQNELVVSVAFSPNGKYVVSGIWDGSAQVWEATTGKIISTMPVISSSSWSDRFSAVSFSPDGKYVVSVSLCEETDSNAECIKSTVRVFDPLTGAEISHMTHSDEMRAIVFSPNGKYIATGSLDNTARIWEPATGKEIIRFNHQYDVRGLAFSPDNRYLVTTDSQNYDFDENIHVWDIETGREISRITHDKEVLSIAVSSDGKYVLSGVWGGTATLSEMTTGKEVLRLVQDDSYAFNTVAFSPSGKYLLSSGDNKAIVWDAATGKELAVLTHESEITSIAFSPDSKYIVSGSNDFTARVWDTLTGKEISRMTHDNVVTSVAFSPNSKFVISGSEDGTARVWEITNNGPITYSLSDTSNSVSSNYLFANYRGNEWQEPAVVLDVETANKINKIFDTYQGVPMWRSELSKNRELLALFPDPGDIAHVWDVESVAEVATFNLNGLVGSATFSPDGKYIVLGSEEDSIAHVWEVKTGKQVFQLTIYDTDNNKYADVGSVGSVDYSQDGKYIVSATIGLATVWDAATGHEISSLIVPGYFSSGITGVAFSPDGKYVLGKDLETDVMIWDVKTGEEIKHISIESHFWGSSSSLIFSPDSKFFVLGTPIDKTARVYDLGTGEEISRMTHDDDVIFIALSPNGEYVVSTSIDSTARVWVTKTGKEIIRFPFDLNDSYVGFSPDSNSVLTGSLFSTTHVWQWQPEYLIGKVCATLPRDLTPIEWKQYIGDALPYQTVCPDFKMIAKNILSNPSDPNRVRNALDKVKAELIKFDVFEDPTSEAFRIVSVATEEQIATEIDAQEVEMALDLIDIAKQMKVQLYFNDPQVLNNLCWYGSLQGYEEQVLDFCERAVMLAPYNGNIRDSQGLARALTGDYQGAILDFQYFIDERNKYEDEPSSDVKLRQQWIIDLRAGKNPFTPAVKDSLVQVVVPVAAFENYYKYTLPWPLVLYIIVGWLAYRAIFLRNNSDAYSDNSTTDWKRFVIAGCQGGLLIILIISGLFISALLISNHIYPETGIPFSPSPLYILLLLFPAGLWAGGVYGHFTRFENGKWRRVIWGSVVGIMSIIIPALVLILILTTMSDDSNSFSTEDLSGLLLGLGIVGGIGGALSAFGSLIYIFGLQKWAKKSIIVNK